MENKYLLEAVVTHYNYASDYYYRCNDDDDRQKLKMIMNSIESILNKSKINFSKKRMLSIFKYKEYEYVGIVIGENNMTKNLLKTIVETYNSTSSLYYELKDEYVLKNAKVIMDNIEGILINSSINFSIKKEKEISEYTNKEYEYDTIVIEENI